MWTDRDVSEHKILAFGLAAENSLSGAFHLVTYLIFGAVEVRRWSSFFFRFDAHFLRIENIA